MISQPLRRGGATDEAGSGSRKIAWRRLPADAHLLEAGWLSGRIPMPDRPTTEQAIASARFSFEQAAVGTERLTNGCGMNLERIFHDDRTGPDAVHQFVLGDKFPH